MWGALDRLHTKRELLALREVARMNKTATLTPTLAEILHEAVWSYRHGRQAPLPAWNKMRVSWAAHMICTVKFRLSGIPFSTLSFTLLSFCLSVWECARKILVSKKRGGTGTWNYDKDMQTQLLGQLCQTSHMTVLGNFAFLYFGFLISEMHGKGWITYIIAQTWYQTNSQILIHSIIPQLLTLLAQCPLFAWETSGFYICSVF